MADDLLLDKVQQLRGHLDAIKIVVKDVHENNLEQYSQTVAWDYYRLVDLLSTAHLVAHRLERVLTDPGD